MKKRLVCAVLVVILQGCASTSLSQQALTPAQPSPNPQRDPTGAVSWIKRISAKVHSQWDIPAGSPATFSCSVKVKLLPNGEIVSAELIRSCGQVALDKSLLNAVFRSDPLPIPENPSDFESNVNLVFVY